VEAAKAAGTPITGTATKVVKGGLVVDVGLRGFLPLSLLSDVPNSVEPASLVGTEVEVLVTEVDRGTDRIVVSRRDLLRKERRKQEKELLAALQPGARVPGTVVSVADYGAVVDLGGVRGLVHRSELTWHRFETVGDVVAVGDLVEVEVLDVQRSKKRVSLSLRRTSPDPYQGLEVGQILDATVTRVVEYGAFMQLDASGAEGLVHISELSDVPGFRPDQLVATGEQVMVKIMEIDRDRRRMALSVRRVLVDD
jgi:small subunit ribosomal protein S1